MSTLRILCISVVFAGSAPGATLRVPADFPTIQEAIDASSSGDTVLVAPGTYEIERPIDFSLGLSGPRDIVVRSEDGAGSTVIRMADLPADPDLACVVLFQGGQTRASVLEGFTISNGRGSGGIACSRSSPTLRELSITGNSAEGGGGGLYCEEGSFPRLEGCAVLDNYAPFVGGGIFLFDSSIDMTGCTIAGNRAPQGAGGFFSSSPTVVIEDTVIASNWADEEGGGLEWDRSSVTISGSAFEWNDAGPGQGGGVLSLRSTGTISRCTFLWNRAGEGGGLAGFRSDLLIDGCAFTGNLAHQGGGLFFDTGDSGTARNCLVAGNRALAAGSGVACREAAPRIQSSTIAENRAGEGGPGIAADRSTPVLTNCIVWDNGGPFLATGGSEIRATRSILEDTGDIAGEGNRNVAPLFAAPGFWDDAGTPTDPSDDLWTPGDYRLGPGSPAMNAGSGDGAPAADIEGQPRPSCDGFDLGAYESAECPETDRFIRGDANADGVVDLSDSVLALGFLFLGRAEPGCLEALDADDGGAIDLSDPIYALMFNFLGGPAPPGPYPECGPDPTPDPLGCQGSPACP